MKKLNEQIVELLDDYDVDLSKLSYDQMNEISNKLQKIIKKDLISKLPTEKELENDYYGNHTKSTLSEGLLGGAKFMLTKIKKL